MNNIQYIFFGALLILALIVGGYGKDLFESDPKTPPPDTIEKKVEVPKVVRETTKVEVPRTVTEYKTIRDTVIREIPVPTDFGRVRGVLPQNYLERTSDAFSVTYFDPHERRYRTETYDLTPSTRKISLDGVGFGSFQSVTIGPALAYESEKLDVSLGYGAGMDQTGFYRTPFILIQAEIFSYNLN